MPHPHLTELHKIYQSETQPFRKVHRMIDLFESLIKIHTVVIIAEYVGHNKLSDAAKGMLAQGLRTPSLGTWLLFSRILFEELQQDGYQWTFNGFAADFIQLDKALNASKTNVIAFRNGYAHGATPTDAQCSSDISQYEPFLLQLLQSPWLQSTHTEHRDQQVWISTDTGQLCLHPILLFKEEGGASPYAFFNDLKNDKVGLLNYPLSKHYREKEFYKEFHQYLPLHEWKKSGNNEFYQRIEELTETFKGRSAERERLLQFVTSRNKGYLSIQGNPGIGKSALIARFFKDLKANEQTKSIQVVEFFIRRGTAQAQVDYLFNYLIRRTDELFPEGREIRAEGRATWELQQQLFSKWRLWGEKSNGSKLLMLIDGLDEGTENNVVTYLPRENYEGILIIYGSRPGGHKSIDELWTQLPVEHHDKLELTGLGKSDIRALIYEVSNKYELDRESEWIDAVQQRSQGNPLYLKLLCDAIEQGSIALNDIHALPEKIDEYYKAILDRYAADVTDGDALLNALFTFAAAKDYLTMAHIGLINRLGEGALQRIGSTLKEVLYENPLTEAVLDYQLFHESFREYLIDKKAKQVNDAAERIIDFCNGWKELEGSWEQKYALEYLSAHLSESKKEARAEALIRLIYDQDYVQTQQKVLKQFEASNTMYRHALKKAGALKREEDMLEAALSLVDLKYAEANDAPQVVAMVASGDIDHALKRIESFGGNDEEGMKRKFTLYMLCLMELTLLDSKDKPFRKSAIEKLLNHLDENILVDHSLLNWNDFFPSYLMFKIACELADMGLDYLRVYKRTDKWDSDWIAENGLYTDLQFEVLLECASGISDEEQKSQSLLSISTELSKQGKLNEALLCTNRICDDVMKSLSLSIISKELSKQAKFEESLECAHSIIFDGMKIETLLYCSTELHKYGKVKEAYSVIKDAHACTYCINDNSKDSKLRDISIELAKQDMVDEALKCAREISNDYFKCESLKKISSQLFKQARLKEASKVLDEALACARGISESYRKSEVLMVVSVELIKQGKIEEALACAQDISESYRKSEVLMKVSIELIKQANIHEALSNARDISENYFKIKALIKISSELLKQGNIYEYSNILQEAINCTRDISEDFFKIYPLKEVTIELIRQGKIDESSNVLQEALSCNLHKSESFIKIGVVEEVVIEFIKQGMMDEALACAREIGDANMKSKLMSNISTILFRQGKEEKASLVMEELYIQVKGINHNDEKHKVLKVISAELIKQEKISRVSILFQKDLTCACGINDDGWKSDVLYCISVRNAKEGKVYEASFLMHKSYTHILGIVDERRKGITMMHISAELFKLGNAYDASSMMEEVHKFARDMNDNGWEFFLLKSISAELSKQGKFEDSIAHALEITDDGWKIAALRDISTELFNKGNDEEASSLMQQAIVFARKINNVQYGAEGKGELLSYISTALFKQGKLDEATLLMEEALIHANGISSIDVKINVLKVISAELFKQGDFEEASNVIEEALACAFNISDKNKKVEVLGKISTELYKQRKLDKVLFVLQESFVFAQEIREESHRCYILKNISTGLSTLHKYDSAEQISMYITQIADRHYCWKNIAKQQKDQLGLIEALKNKNKFQSEEAQIFYLKGWAESVNVDDISPELAHDAMLALVNDSTSLEHFLQVYAQYELFFGNPSKEKIDRLNKSLNVQWALDIIAQFPSEQKEQRLSTNLSEWIDQISDEDDREEIELLARKVAKGKMTEEEFGERLKEF